MLETIKEIILDFQESELEDSVPRRLELRRVARKATVIIGARRAGKSTFMLQVARRLVDEGVSRQNLVHVNFFDDRLYPLRQAGCAPVLEAVWQLYPEKKDREKMYFFFDEIQAVPGWEAFVERLLRTEKCEVFLTGSSAHLLSRELATAMRGRALSWELFPYSFREFLQAVGVPVPANLTTKARLAIWQAFEQYWESGGFPEVTGLPRGVRVRIHQEYLLAMLFRDIVERHDSSHPRAVTQLAHRLADNVGSLYSINKLTAQLKDAGHRIPKTAVAQILEWFEDAYFLFSVRLYDASWARSNVNPKKIYCVDHAMARSIGSGVLLNDGHLLENLVFLGLRRRAQEVFYYRCASGREVDFLVVLPDRRRLLVQVCRTLAEPATRRRELAALADAMGEMDLPEAVLVTRDEEETVALDGRTVRVVAAWRFLLELEADAP